MVYEIKGEFNTGLEVFFNDKRLFYSKSKTSFFKPVIVEIFDNRNKLILKINISGIFLFQIEVLFYDSEYFNKGFSFYKSERNQIVYGKNLIKLDYGILPLKRTFLLNKERIGKVKSKFISFNENCKIYFSTDNQEIINYCLILYLTFNTINYDVGE